MFQHARLRLTLMYAISGVVLFSALAAGMFVVVVALLDREIDSDIEHVLDEGSQLMTVDPEGEGLDVPTTFGPVFLFAFSPEGSVIRNPRELPAEQVVPAAVVRIAAQTMMEQRITRRVEGERFRLHMLPITRDDAVSAVLVAGRSLARRDDEIRVYATTLIAGGIVWAVLASAVAFVLAGRALRPVRLAYQRQEAFVAGAAHELRSPLGVIRAASEVGLRGDPPPETRTLLTEIRAVAVDAAGLVDTLLDLARMRPPGDEPGLACDLADAVGRELSRMEPLLREHDIRVIDDLGAVEVPVPPSDVGRITRALLENVIAHAPRGTTTLVRTRSLGSTGELSVSDDGPGVPLDELSAIFEPFARGDESRRRDSRVGLGLAIVRTVADHRGGEVRARPSPEGGLLVEVTFPAV